MKTILRMILIFVLVSVVFSFTGCGILTKIINHSNENYWKYSKPKGEIETKYTALGSYDVSFAEFDAKNDVWKKYEIWYPSEMKEGATYPLVIMANGTGIGASKYKEVFYHLASWGFIVAGNEDENSRTGESSAATLDFILSLNDNKDSIFFEKIDVENIGIAGHSQGGVGAINAATNQPNGNMYKAIWSASATSRYHADELNKSGDGWSCDLSIVHIPIFMVAGTNHWDAGDMTEYSEVLPEGKGQGICPLWWLNECFDAVSKDVDMVIARQIGKDHGDILHSADGYMTAWFMYYLKGDTDSGKAFFGENAEILTNENWQDVKLNDK